MTQLKSFWRRTLLRIAAVGMLAACVRFPVCAHEKMPTGVEALLYTTMPSTSVHRPEMAMDGDPKSYFRSAYNPD